MRVVPSSQGTSILLSTSIAAELSGEHFLHSLSYGRDPYATLRVALGGRRRALSLLFEREGHDDVPMMLIWRRGSHGRMRWIAFNPLLWIPRLDAPSA
jgi:hypothetical protein